MKSLKSKLDRQVAGKSYPLKIIPMRLIDILEVKELEVENKLSTWTLEDYKNELDRTDSITLVAKSSNKVIGFLIARLITNLQMIDEITDDKDLRDGEAEIYNIGIKKDFQRKGIGKSLLKELLECSKRAYIGRVWLDVRESNDVAKRFYINQGFETVYKRKNFYSNPSEDSIVMCFRVI